jgi:hypothetical protein
MDSNFNVETINIVLSSLKNIKCVGLSFNNETELKNINGISYCVIGKDYEDEMAINAETLEVYILSNNKKIFINKSLDHLIDCINYFNQKINLDEDNYEAIKRRKKTKEIIKGIKKIDTEALSNEENWWSLILEQVTDGLL